MRILDPLLARQPDDRATLLATVDAKLSLAAVADDPQAAQQLRSDALNATTVVQSGRGDPRLLALQVEALLALNRKAEAQPVIRQLWSSGYRDAALLGVLRQQRIAYPVNAAFQQQLLAAVDGNARE